MFSPLICLGILLASSPQAEIQSTIDSYLKAVREFDHQSLDRLFHKEYVEVSPLGEVDDRAKTISFYQIPVEQRGPLPKAITAKELSVRLPSDDVAICIFREDVEMDRGGQTMTISFRVTSVLKREEGRWVFVSNHANGIRKPQGSQG